jgi:hypothetical protein
MSAELFAAFCEAIDAFEEHAQFAKDSPLHEMVKRWKRLAETQRSSHANGSDDKDDPVAA